MGGTPPPQPAGRRRYCQEIEHWPGNKLADVVHSWKSFTAKQANDVLERRGIFWQREYYDRLIRDAQELERAIRYVAENPEKAGLHGWKWVWVCGRDARTTAGEDAGATVGDTIDET